MSEGLIIGEDGKVRCFWCGSDPLYVAYHDQEWGRRKTSDQALFEKLCLEGFQAGLSWLTVLKKRPAFRAAFHDFEIDKVAAMSKADVSRLLQNADIIRHAGKIRSAIHNAARTRELIAEYGSFYLYLQDFVPDKRTATIDRQFYRDVTVTPESRALSKDLKKRGFTFVGPTIMYAYMQSVGLVNDHIEGCAFRKACNF